MTQVQPAQSAVTAVPPEPLGTQGPKPGLQSAAHLFVPAFCTEAHDIGHFLAAPSLQGRQLCRLGRLLPYKALNDAPDVPPGLHQWRQLSSGLGNY